MLIHQGSASGFRSRVKAHASNLAQSARDFSKNRLPVDIFGVADRVVSRSQSIWSTTYSNATAAVSVTTQTATDTLSHATNVGILSLPREIGRFGLQTIGLAVPGPEYTSVQTSIGKIFIAYKRLLLFEESEDPSKKSN